jgi:UDP-glucuronate decarboxylase
MEKEKTISLVTGGAGFIGSFLCGELLKGGNRVICVDNFSTGHVRNIEPYLRNPDFQFLRHDITEPLHLDRFPELEPFKVKFLGVQEIYHLATPNTITHFEDRQIDTLLANSLGTKHMLDLAVQYKAPILLGSSAVVYGAAPEGGAMFEESYKGIVDHLAPHACYEEGKRFAETMLYTYGRVHGIDTKIARIFHAYGPRMPLFDGHIIPDMILAALNNEAIHLPGDTDAETSLVYVLDIVDGLLRMMSGKERIGPVNLGSDQRIAWNEVAKRIVELTGSESTIVAGKDSTLNNIGVPDVTKAKSQLGWLPVVLLDDGFQKTIDYIKANKLLLTGDSQAV